MGILGTLDRCINSIPKDLILNLVVYVELSNMEYELLKAEVNSYTETPIEFTLKEHERVKDFGKCTILTYMGYKFIIVVDEKKTTTGDFYFAFKTKVI